MAQVAIADDSTPIRLLFSRRLEAAGHQVIEAVDRAELIELIEARCSGAIDLALVDWMMPRLDGAGATAAIRSKWPGMPVIGFTAGLPPTEVESPATPDAFIAKPFDFDYLFETIRELTDGPPRP